MVNRYRKNLPESRTIGIDKISHRRLVSLRLSPPLPLYFSTLKSSEKNLNRLESFSFEKTLSAFP